MMKKAFIHIALLLFANIGFSQNAKIDSLIKNLPHKADTNQLKSINEIGWVLVNISEYDSAIVYETKALTLAEKLLSSVKRNERYTVKKNKAKTLSIIGVIHWKLGNYSIALDNHFKALNIRMEIQDKIGTAMSYNNIGLIYDNQGNYQDALKNQLAALHIRQEIKDTAGLAMSYNNVGTLYQAQGNYPEALKNHFASLKIREAMGDKAGISMSYSNIGIIYFHQSNFSEALKCQYASLKLSQELDNKQRIAQNYGFIANIYQDQGKYTEALQNYYSSLKISELIGDKLTSGHDFNNIGMIYYKLGDYQKALENSLKSLKTMEAIGEKHGMSSSYITIGDAYAMGKKYSEAIINLNKGLELAKGIGSKKNVLLICDALTRVYEKQQNFPKAYQYYQESILYRDSLFNEESLKKSVQAQMQYEFDKQKEISKHQHAFEIQKQSNQRNLYLGGAGFLLLTSFFAFTRARLKQRHNHQKQLNQKQKELASAVMETQEQERKRIAEDIHDSLGHLLSTVKLNLQTVSKDQKGVVENALQLLDQASREIRDISFNLMPRTLEEEGLAAALKELADKTSNSSTLKVLFHTHGIENIPLEKQAEFTMYRIVQEAVNNILKHAQAKEINIQFIKHDGFLVIMIEDDGTGFDISLVKKNGRGLKNIQTRAEWLNGKVAIDSTPARGTTLFVEMPL